MYLYRTFLAWLLIIAAETLHGTLRQILLVPVAGDQRARQLAFITGILLIFGILYVLIDWIGAERRTHLFVSGLTLSLLTLAFEVGFGYFVLGYSMARVAADLDIARGGMMGLGLTLMIFAPHLVRTVKRRRRMRPARSGL